MGIAFSIFITGLVFYLMGRGFKSKEKGWYGPRQTPEQVRDSYRFMFDHLEQFPHSSLAKDYPEIHRQVVASLRYRVINELWANKAISEADYEKELEEIAALIDISHDLPTGSHVANY